ncbi:glycoside hydrolase family 2 TIM barrel-domain containing protein [Paenibacillus protaetiae]|uniref:glycoside hydrolase family 2 TIM barrel-domain containing protein n=1 Tax=Paenibacillus protaetiae TaxID=2509456 RepID=UPI0026A728C5
MSTKKKFNTGWSFAKQPIGTDLKAVTNDAVAWMPVTLPHDWLIYDSRNLYENGEGWYRKTFELNESESSGRITLYFEGVYMNSAVFVNGCEAGTWKNGYSSFEIDITPYIVTGRNEVYVQAVYESPNSRWYSGAGIYRPVWLKSYPDSHIASDGIYISARQQNESNWLVQIGTEVRFAPAADSSASCLLRHTAIDPSGTVAARQETAIAAAAGELVTFQSDLSVDQPLVWDTEHPYCYKLVTELVHNGATIDREEQPFGFRTFTFDSQTGFYLNGRHMKLNGVCQHHDLGCLGAAVNKTALRRQIKLLQEMGVNAIRTAHNMPAVELMELADEMGVLIVSEAFDMWERQKTPYDYARFFPEWWEKDVASWVRRDRNHPSLLMWSIGNEIYDTHADERGQQLTVMLRDKVLEHDPRGNASVTIGSNYMPWENAQKCADLVAFAGYNYGENYYELHHQQHPDWIIYGSETCSTVQSRGIYHFPLSQSVLADDDEQCSSLGNSSTSWGPKAPKAALSGTGTRHIRWGSFCGPALIISESQLLIIRKTRILASSTPPASRKTPIMFIKRHGRAIKPGRWSIFSRIGIFPKAS